MWNGSKWLSDYIDANGSVFADKRILELGAGAGVPSLMAVRAGARRVISTDYPDDELIVNIRKNIDHILSAEQRERIAAIGYLWGSDEGPLLETNKGQPFDMIFMCDVIFNHSEHRALLRTINKCLRTDGQGIVWCAFSHYRPLFRDKDLELLRLAEEEFGFLVEKVDKVCYDRPMTGLDANDPRDVYAYTIKIRM